MDMQATGQTIAAPRPALSHTDLSIPRSKRWGTAGGVGPGRRPPAFSGALVLLLAPRASHAGERLDRYGRLLTRILFSLPQNGGAHRAPARERRGHRGPASDRAGVWGGAPR
jgi:hypothetical protein